MDNFDFKKIGAFLAFLAFAAVSCWATAESLYLSIDDMYPAVCYVISIGFFVVASIGTVLLAKGFNSYVSLDNSTLTIVGGLFMVIAFWLLCSMPTNTHTFVYRDKGKSVVIDDVECTLGYLEQLQNNDLQEDDIIAAQRNLESNVSTALRNLIDEIRNPLNRGFGESARKKLNDLSLVLGSTIAETTIGARSSLTPTECEQLIERIQIRVEQELDQKKQEIRDIMTANKTESFRKEANENIANLKGIQLWVQKDSINYYDRDRMGEIIDKLGTSYGTIKKYSEFIKWNSDEDRYNYTRENPITKVESITSVFNVWKDIFTGKYVGHGLWYWIVLSILVDVAAFIFFNIAFGTEED